MSIKSPPSRFNFAQYLIDQNAGRSARAAVIDDAGSMTYGELSERIRLLAAALQALGLRREERVLLLMNDCAQWPVAFLGSMYAGLVPVAVNTILTADDYAYMLEHSRAQAVLVSGALLPKLAGALSQASHEVKHVIVAQPTEALKPTQIEFNALLQGHSPLEYCASTQADDPAFWLYSSGSTGRPKGTVHSHANPYWTIELYAKGILGLTEDDVCFSAAKLFFAYGLGNALSFPFGVGATALLMAERATPGAIFKRLAGAGPGVRPTVFCAAPTIFAGMLASPQLPAGADHAMRLVTSAGEALPAEIGERFKAHFGVDIVDGIGSTEMLHIFISNRPGQVRYGTTGWPVPGYEVELRDDEGNRLAPGQSGILHVRGPSAAMMYWGNREKTRETFVGGWIRSGDRYTCNADGTYTYGGRCDDMLKVGGVYVSPFEIEATLIEHPAVLEAAVIGVPDTDGLTKTKAFVVLKTGLSASCDELKAFVKSRLAPYKYPRAIEFVTELPKTATGKIQRFKLREQEAAR